MSQNVTVGGWHIQRPHVVIVTRNFTERSSLFLSHPLTDRFTSSSPSFPSPSRSLPARSKAPSHCGRCAPDLPTLAVMQYETRNDESAYVSHVMEIPLLIRALNDSTTAGYITCIITLMAAGIYGRKAGGGGGEGSSFFPFFFRLPPPTRSRYYRQVKRR